MSVGFNGRKFSVGMSSLALASALTVAWPPSSSAAGAGVSCGA
jgi:hypothetical protein